jgi:hypothetical protein
MKKLSIILGFSLLFWASAYAADRPPILPGNFAGWRATGAVKTSSDSTVADPAYAPLLKEYGFTDFESVAYTRDDGRKVQVKAARFADVSGAFGAYTFYCQPEMVREEIGDQASSFNQRILFYRGNVLVDAVFDRVTAMSAAELRDLASALPRPAGSAGNAPPVLAYMPRAGYIRNTEKYVTGPLGLAQISSPLPANLVDFAAGAEVVLGRYKAGNGEAVLAIINYPTPQIAAEHMGHLDGQRGAPPAGNTGSGASAEPIYEKRTGPLLVIVSGGATESEAKSLLSAVNYDADVTWNESTGPDKRNNLGLLLVNIILLCAILIGFALIFGLAFGGIRIGLQRLFPGRVFERPERAEFIALHLADGPPEAGDNKLSSSIKAS